MAEFKEEKSKAATPGPDGRDQSDGEAMTVCGPLRYGLLAFGLLNVGLGILGAFLPVMPTTVTSRLRR